MKLQRNTMVHLNHHHHNKPRGTTHWDPSVSVRPLRLRTGNSRRGHWHHADAPRPLMSHFTSRKFIQFHTWDSWDCQTKPLIILGTWCSLALLFLWRRQMQDGACAHRIYCELIKRDFIQQVNGAHGHHLISAQPLLTQSIISNVCFSASLTCSSILSLLWSMLNRFVSWWKIT